ncbi:cysteine-rich RLK (RECEPTOR-like protein kinase) 26 [Artemisia annua]|uniref:Cysteine-rich RLK (RECEPTOR-like protein kinase) 26 n=1 Tax=Artemisia annua TaxID=35608 RepID=A0A2U1NSW8_ARTAN|nr:cysteine-rich RLK (RECEPTOR-like protein kinase) 26 [Artemisia annua]
MMIKLVRNQILLWFSFIFVYLIINTTTTSLAQSDLPFYYCENDRNYTTNSTFETNLNTTFSILPTTNNGFGFYNFSTGQGSDTIYSISLCRGDINPDICLSCLNNAIGSIRKVCSYKLDVVAFYEYCSFLYTKDPPLLGNTDPWFYVYNYEPENTTNVDWFTGALIPLMDTLRIQASNGGPLKKFASGNTKGPDFTTIYALVQCTPELSKQECNYCLEDIINRIPNLCNGKVGGRIILHTCNLRYDIKLFFNGSNVALEIPPPPPSTHAPLEISPRPPPGKKKNTTKTVTIVIVTMTVIGVIMVASLCVMIRSKKRKMKQAPLMPPKLETMDIGTPESLQYDFVKVKDATNDFSEDNKLGRGGFGAVYKGVFEDGHEIAVKRLAVDSGQGDVEFKNEVLLVARLQHRNLVRLLGFSIHGNERLLIYEFLPNASLDYFLFEYILHGHFSVKTDVFSFGVLLLEIVAGQRNHGFQTIQNLLSFAWKRWENGTPSDMIDPTLKTGSAGSLSNIIRSIHIGLLCVQENVADRPPIGSVVLMLNGFPILLPQPSQPAFLVHSTSTDPEMPLSQECSSSSGTSGLERPELSKINLRPSPFSVNGVTISDIVPR